MEYDWKARPVKPMVALYAVAVFIPFILYAHFVAHSPAAVKALFFAAIGGVASMTPVILSRKRYCLTESGISVGPAHAENPTTLKTLFAWNELSHIVPTKAGFKYYKRLDEQSALRRFWKLHLSDQYSGEVHVEPGDQDRVMEIIREKGILLGGRAISSP